MSPEGPHIALFVQDPGVVGPGVAPSARASFRRLSARSNDRICRRAEDRPTPTRASGSSATGRVP